MLASIPFLVLMALTILVVVLGIGGKWPFFRATLPLTVLFLIALGSFQMAYFCTYQVQDTVVSLSRLLSQTEAGTLATAQINQTTQFIASLPVFGLFCFLGILFTVLTWAIVIFPPQLFFIALGLRCRWSLFVLPLNIFLPASLIAFLLAFSLSSWLGDILAYVDEGTLRNFLSSFGPEARQIAAQISNQEIQAIGDTFSALSISSSQLFLTAGNLLTAFLWTLSILLISFITILVLLWRLKVLVALTVLVILGTVVAGPIGFFVTVGLSLFIFLFWITRKVTRKESEENYAPAQLEEYNESSEYNAGAEYNEGSEYNANTEYDEYSEYDEKFQE
jgi:hypothetical protein